MQAVKMRDLRQNPIKRIVSKLTHHYAVVLTSGSEVEYDEERCVFFSKSSICEEDKKELVELLALWDI